MGRFAKTLQKEKAFVAVYAGMCSYTNIGDKEKLFCFNVNRGYIETISYAVCMELMLTLESLGAVERSRNIEEIQKNGATIKHRYRFRVENLIALAQACSVHNLVLSAEKGLSLSSKHIGDAEQNLSEYLKWQSEEMQEKGLYTWLETALKIEFRYLCEKVLCKTDIEIAKENNRGLLYRAPYLSVGCGGVLFAENTELIDKPENTPENITDYILSGGNMHRTIRGFTERNLARDTKIPREKGASE
jgi:hypothetical protein